MSGSLRSAVRRFPARLSVLAALLGLLGGCGKASVTNPPPANFSVPPPPPEGPYVATITAAGVSPLVLHVWTTRTAVFVNGDTQAHAIFADPHPAHSECQGMLNIGKIKPGERREIPNLPIDGCFYHDDNDPANKAFQGVVVIH